MRRSPVWSERMAARIARLGKDDAEAWTRKCRDPHPDDVVKTKPKGKDDE